jgi:CubicO group peptidase (beta-lactamase class C family)
MRLFVRIGVAAFLLEVAWTAVVILGSAEGWWRKPLAPRGDPRAFMDAASEVLSSENRGNAVVALLQSGALFDEHAVSVGDPVDRDTVFQVASLSKWITAWGVMNLVEEGKIDLDAPVSRYLRRWKLPESAFDRNGVTVSRLLSHTAGLTDGLGYAGFEPGTRVQTLEESLTRTADTSPGASGVVQVGLQPGTEWRYSGGGYTILQLLIEEVTGEPFESYMQRTVLEPLGMSHSTFEWTPDRGTRLATFYDLDSRPAAHYRFTAVAAASLYTSVSDLTRFLQAHLPGAEGEPVGRTVLDEKTLEEMWRPHASRFGQHIWGLGTILYASNNQGGYIVGHDGNNDPAINTAARLNPATGNGIVVLETGSSLLATKIAGEWVIWETGNVDLLTFMMEAPAMSRTAALGGIAILLGALLAFWRLRRSRAGAAGAAGGA